MSSSGFTASPVESALSRERRKLALTLEIGRALASSSGRETLYERIIDNVTQIMEAERSTLYLLEDDGQTLVSKVAQGGPAEIRLQVGEGIAGATAEWGKTVNVVDAYNDARFQPAVDVASGFETRSVLCTPMTNSVGVVVGVLQVLNKQSGAFTSDDEELLEALAGQVAIAVENSVLYHEAIDNNLLLMAAGERLRKKSNEISVLLQLEREVANAVSVREIYDRLLQAAMDLVGARAGSIALVTGDGHLRFETTAGPAADDIRGRRIPMEEGVIGWVATRQEPVIVNTPEEDPRHDRGLAAELGGSPEGLIAAPLTNEGEVVGAIELLDKRGGFSDSDLQLLQLIASQVARAVVTARRRAERDAEDRLATIGEMMAGVLHDLRTPMTVISGYAELMAISRDQDAREKYAAQVQRQFEVMNGMIREILMFARGETQVLLTSFPLNLFFKDVDPLLRPMLEQRGIDFAIEAEFAGEIKADRVKLLRLVTNLAQNAANALSRGGHFTIHSARDGDFLVLEFIDDGPGIPSELEGRLFDAFATGTAGGTGLGLAIVKRIVDQHDGTISTEPVEGGGTRFRVRLPIAGAATARAE